MRLTVIVLLFMLVATPVGAQSHPLSEPVVIPITLAEGLVYIPATLDDSLSLSVILDTGAGLDVLATSQVRRVGGRPAGVVTGHRMTGERLDIPLWVVPNLQVGPLASTDAVVGSWGALDSFGLDGIISLMGFRKQPFTIDFTAGTVTLESPRSLARRRAEGQVSPLLLDDLRGRALDVFAAFSFAGHSGECLLDTGTQATRANTRYLAALGIDSSDASVTKRSFRAVTGAVEDQYVASVPRVALASAPEVAATDTRVTFSDIIYDCVIGTSFWQGRALTIDIAGRELIVSK